MAKKFFDTGKSKERDELFAYEFLDKLEMYWFIGFGINPMRTKNLTLCVKREDLNKLENVKVVRLDKEHLYDVYINDTLVMERAIIIIQDGNFLGENEVPDDFNNLINALGKDKRLNYDALVGCYHYWILSVNPNILRIGTKSQVNKVNRQLKRFEKLYGYYSVSKGEDEETK